MSVRLFNTYGPYETNRHLIPEILRGLAAGPTIRLGNTHTRRDYIHVDDVADALYRSALADASQSVVNIGTGASHSAAEIVGILGGLVGRPVHIQTDPDRVRSIDKRDQRAAIDRLSEVIGPPGFRSLTDGLRALLMHEGLVPPEAVRT